MLTPLVRARRPWFFGPVVGAALGAVVLGAGGRLAMRGVALHAGAAGVFTIEGTITVVLAGAGSGAAGGGIRGLLDLAGRLPAWARFALFAVACLLLTLRGLHPLDPVRLALFLPLVGAYAALMEVAWRRLAWWRRTAALRTEANAAV